MHACLGFLDGNIVFLGFTDCMKAVVRDCTLLKKKRKKLGGKKDVKVVLVGWTCKSRYTMTVPYYM